jgi:hypothetical protein
MDWKPYELEGPVTSYNVKLERGLKIEGRIVDEKGFPVAGASIGFTGPGLDATERENVAFHQRLAQVQSDASGRFVSRQMPGKADFGVGFFVTHPDFALQWQHVLIPEGLQTNWNVVLSRGVSLDGRVVDTGGEGISSATVLVPEPHGGPDVSAQTDTQGNFTLAHQPLGVVSVEVTAPGFKQLKRSVLVESNTAPLVLELQSEVAMAAAPTHQQRIRLSGSVVDAESRQPIPQFKVLLDERRGSSPYFLGEGREGKFDWENSLTFALKYTLEIDAEGYEPQVSSVRQRADGDQAFDFRLKRGGSILGQVLQPDGQPAAGATVGLQGDRFSPHFEPPAKLLNYGAPANETTTDARGLFSLKSMVGMESILVVHDTGCAVVPALASTNLVVQLEAWGAIEGTVYLGGKLLGGETVDVGFQSVSYAQNANRLHFDLMRKTDQDGHFRFNRVPPGSHTAYRMINRHPGQTGEIGFSHGEPVMVRPGQTAYVTLGGKGRAVIGQLVLVPPLTNYNWTARLLSLVQDRPELLEPREDQFSSSAAFFNALNAYMAAKAKYYLDFNPDGSFRIDDVLPGQYTLAVSITAPPADPLREDAWMYPGPVLGGITNIVVVPPSLDEQKELPLDLGPISVHIRVASAAKNY